MSDAFLPFAQPEIDDDEINEVVSTMRSGWLTTGPQNTPVRGRFRAIPGRYRYSDDCGQLCDLWVTLSTRGSGSQGGR